MLRKLNGCLCRVSKPPFTLRTTLESLRKWEEEWLTKKRSYPAFQDTSPTSTPTRSKSEMLALTSMTQMTPRMYNLSKHHFQKREKKNTAARVSKSWICMELSPGCWSRANPSSEAGGASAFRCSPYWVWCSLLIQRWSICIITGVLISWWETSFTILTALKARKLWICTITTCMWNSNSCQILLGSLRSS